MHVALPEESEDDHAQRRQSVGRIGHQYPISISPIGLYLGLFRLVARCYTMSRSIRRNAPIAIMAMPDTRLTMRAAEGRERSSRSAPNPTTR
jgi:hypothetical protein